MGMFVIANLALVWPFRSRPNVAILVAITACLNASVWYYLNEIRPYIMLYMGTCLMTGASIEAMRSKQRPSSFAITVLCIGAIIASGATVIGIAWAASPFLFIILYWVGIRKRPLSELANNNYLALAITLVCIIALIAHDIRMFALGKLPALLGRITFSHCFFHFMPISACWASDLECLIYAQTALANWSRLQPSLVFQPSCLAWSRSVG